MYPEDAIQWLIEPDPWWEKTTSQTIERGFLLRAFIPYVDQIPYQILPKGRKQPNKHDEAIVTIKPLDMKSPYNREDLPVAAMSPLHKGEIWTAYRAKIRPCIVLAKGGTLVEQSVRSGMPKRNTSHTLLVAPYYGIDQDGTRAGYPPVFVERVRHMRYPQFFWDKLPLSSVKESILRIDQTQAIGRIDNSFEITGYKLSKDAMAIMDDVFNLYMFDKINTDGYLADFIKQVSDSFYTQST